MVEGISVRGAGAGGDEGGGGEASSFGASASEGGGGRGEVESGGSESTSGEIVVMTVSSTRVGSSFAKTACVAASFAARSFSLRASSAAFLASSSTFRASSLAFLASSAMPSVSHLDLPPSPGTFNHSFSLATGVGTLIDGGETTCAGGVPTSPVRNLASMASI